MADRHRTPHLTVRIPADLRDAAKAKAAERGETLTDVIRRALEEYARD